MSYWTLSTRDRDSLLVVSINSFRYNSPRPPCPKLLPQNTPESFLSRRVTTLCRPNAHDTLARNRRLKLIPENRYTGFWRVCRAIWYRIIPVPVSGKELYVSCWRSFHVAAPAVWNALPSQLRSSSVSRGQFRAGLKTHLFTQACMRTPLKTCVEERIILHLRGTGFRRRLLVCVS